MPRISTIYSNENYGIMTKSENLKAKKYFGTAADFELAFDDKMLVNPTDTSLTPNLGLQFKDGHVGMISQVKYFLKDFNKNSMVNNTVFQGSMDGTTYTDLFAMD